MNSTDIADMSLPTSIPGGSPDILHRKFRSCLTNQLNLPAMMEENLSKLKTPLSLFPLQANQANSVTFLQQLQHISPVDFQQLPYQTPSEHKLKPRGFGSLFKESFDILNESNKEKTSICSTSCKCASLAQKVQYLDAQISTVLEQTENMKSLMAKLMEHVQLLTAVSQCF